MRRVNFLCSASASSAVNSPHFFSDTGAIAIMLMSLSARFLSSLESMNVLQERSGDIQTSIAWRCQEFAVEIMKRWIAQRGTSMLPTEGAPQVFAAGSFAVGLRDKLSYNKHRMDRKLIIEYGDDVLFSLGMSAEQFSEEARFLLAAKLYELGKVTSGQAARLSGKGRVDFLMSLTRVGIPVSNLQPEDADAELDFARNG